MSDLVIRRLTAGDGAHVQAFGEELPLPYAYFDGMADSERRRYRQDVFEARIARPSVKACVIQEGERIHGVAIFEAMPWDTEQLGVKSARLDIHLAGAGRDASACATRMQREISTLIRQEQYEFVWTKCASDCPSIARSLEDAGFRIVDCEQTLAWRGRVPVPPDNRPAVTIDLMKPEDVSRLAELGGLFLLSRIGTDPRISGALAEQFWRRAIEGCCSGFADEVLVARVGEEPAAFVAMRDDAMAASCFQKPVRSFYLVGVSERFQGRGIGRALLSASIDRSLKQTPWIEVETQSRNGAALRLYQSVGFEIVKSAYAFHYWSG